MSSLVLVKPDAIEHRLLGWCIGCFEEFGIQQMRLTWIDPDLCAKHYADHIEKPFYPGLQEFMCSGPVCAIAVKGDVNEIRQRALNIRNYYRQHISGPRNLIHASDCEEAAKRELNIWFY